MTAGNDEGFWKKGKKVDLLKGATGAVSGMVLSANFINDHGRLVGFYWAGSKCRMILFVVGTSNFGTMRSGLMMRLACAIAVTVSAGPARKKEANVTMVTKPRIRPT